MKKLLLLFAALGISFLVSCEKEEEITSLEGTTWGVRGEYGNGGWSEYKLMFTDTHAIYISTNDAQNNESFTGTYTFDPPIVLITSSCLTITGSPPTGTIVWEQNMVHKGTIRGRTMETEIRTPGMGMIVFLKKQ